MKLLTLNAINANIETIENHAAASRNPGKRFEFAKDFAEFCCFHYLLCPMYDIIKFIFSENDEWLEVTCCNDGYRINGRGRKNSCRYIVNWEIDRIFSKNQLYNVINEVKMFFMGQPCNCVLFTGAFCPPHIGHRALIERSLNEGYDYAIVAVSNQNFVKKKFEKAEDKSGIIYSEEERIRMMLAMTYDIPNVLIYGIERGYTYEVLCDAKKEFGIKSLSFACGSDKIGEVHKWGFHDKLLCEYGFYILQRGDDEYDDLVKKCNSLFDRYKIIKKAEKYADISSTEIRERMESGQGYDGLVTKKVAEIMKKI